MSEPKTYTQEELTAELTKSTKGIRAELTEEREKSKNQLDALASELQALKDAQDTAASNKEKAALEKKGEFDKALEKHKSESQKIIDTKDVTIAELRAENRKFTVDNAILGFAKDANNPDHVVNMLTSMHTINTKDNGKLEILREDGTPVLNKDSGQPATLKELTENFLTEFPQYVKASGDGGAGTRRGVAPEPDTFKSLIKVAAEAGNKQEVIRLKAAQQQQLIKENDSKTIGSGK